MLIVKEVEVIKIQEMPAICLQNIGPYEGDSNLFGELFGKLFRWAGDRGLISFPLTKMLTVYHDNPDTTPEAEQKISVCITVPKSAEAEDEMVKIKISGGKYAVGHFEVSADEYGEAWSYLTEKWLSESNFSPDEKPCFELYLNDPETHPEKKHIVDIYIPVKLRSEA